MKNIHDLFDGSDPDLLPDTQHVYPVNDLREHVMNSQCWCNPTVDDGREAIVHRMPPGPDRWKNRSRTYLGIANAMASQWGGELEG